MEHPSDVVMPLDYKEFNKLQRKQRVTTGSASEFMVAADLAQQGYTIAFPATVSPKWDLICDTGEELVRVQIKTLEKGTGKNKVKIPTGTYRYYSKYYISNSKLKRQYGKSDFDILAAVDRTTRVVYYVPITKLDFSLVTYVPTDEELETFKSLKDSLKVLDKQE